MWPMSQPKGIERGCLARGISGLSNNITAAVTELHKAAKYASHANHAKNPANQRDDEAYEAYPHNCIGGQTYERYRTSLVQTFNRILPHLAATTPRQLSLIAWSMARLKLTPGSEHFLFAEMLRRASELDTQGISMVMWSFASLSEVTTEPLFNLLAFFRFYQTARHELTKYIERALVLCSAGEGFHAIDVGGAMQSCCINC